VVVENRLKIKMKILIKHCKKYIFTNLRQKAFPKAM